jgi:plasmid maintenance system antidote protein VapI
MNEQWKNIENFSRYEISSLGNIRNKNTQKYLKLRLNFAGYVHINLINDENKTKSVFAHRLVGKSFIENIDNKPTIHHINFIRNDNRVENLQWATVIEQNNNKMNKKYIIHHSNNVIWRLSLNNEKIEKYFFLKDAVEWCIQNNITDNNLHRIVNKNISNVTTGKKYSAYGYKWIRQNDVEISNEIWKEVPIEYTNNMKNIWVSNTGKIKYNNNKITYGHSSGGYLKISFNKKSFFVHRIVAQAFIDNIDNKEYINHKDGNRTNNNIDNLEWVTPKENTEHAINTGLSSVTKKIIQFDLNMNKINEFMSINDAAKILNIKRQNISAVCEGKSLTAGGFIFLFKNDYDPNKQYNFVEFNNNKKSVVQLDYMTNDIIETYNSLSSAADILNIQVSHISSCCKGKRNSTGGFKFMYLNDYNDLK